MTKQKSLNFLIRLFTLTAGLLFSAELALGLPEAPDGKEWVAVTNLTDEFDSWNSSKWHKSLWNYGEPVQMVAENSGVADGNLWIQATLDSTTSRWFKTSRVMSHEQIRFPMYTECNMRTAHISAYNTFWLNNGDANDRDEFDICENNSKPSYTSQTYRPYTMYSQYFIVKDGVTERNAGDFDNRNLSVTNSLRGVPWNEAYHTLGAWWIDKNNIQFYLDGEPAGSVVTIQDFTLEQNIIWDLWTIDASWAGGIANQADLLDDSINTMYVDWIHTYKLEDKIGDPLFAETEIVGDNMVMQVTNGTYLGLFDLLSSTDLQIPVESWTAAQSGLLFDVAGEATVTNPVSESQEFYRILDLGERLTPVTGVSVSPASDTIGVARTIQLTATVTPENATYQSVIWSSETPAVASVNTNGLVTALQMGSSVITATTQDGGFTDTSTITVSTNAVTIFDWTETTGSGRGKWEAGIYTETDNGVTMTTSNRIYTADGQPYAIKYAYGTAEHDHNPGFFTMDIRGVPVNFKVASIDISQATGTDAGSTKHVQGKLADTVQWEIIAPENGVTATYTAPTSGNMDLEIDTIEWHAGWIDGGGYGPESTIDNLQIVVDE